MTKNFFEIIEHVMSVVCVNAITDKDSNTMSLINLIERLNVTLTPTVEAEKKRAEIGWYSTPIVVQVVSRFYRKEEGTDMSFDLQSYIVGPEGKSMGANKESTFAFPKNLKNLRMVGNIAGFPVSMSGMYYVVVRIKDVGESDYVEVARIPIEVSLTVKTES